MGVAFHAHPACDKAVDHAPPKINWTQKRGRVWEQVADGYQFQRYAPPGPVAAAYIESRHPVPIIMGPAGSGKTVASAFKGPHLASNWFPICKDGVVRVKLTVLRPTYRDMARTALESWHNERLFPEKHPFTVEYTGGIDRPVVHKLEWATIRDRTKVKVEFMALFAAVGDTNPEQFAKGFETSFVWLNECDLFSERIPGLMFSRTGRFPSMDQIAPADLDRVMAPYRQAMMTAGINLGDDDVLLPRMLWGDCNPPDVDNWVIKRLIEEPEKWPLYRLFRQPSGLSPDAENRLGKTRASYEQDLQTMTAYDARRFVHGEPGYALDGRPVYEQEFALQVHRSDEPLRPSLGLPLAIGMDAGGSPAAIIGQFMPNGQLRALAEICADPGTGPSRFAEMIYARLLNDFAGFPIRKAFADPSSFYGADKAAGELAWVEIVARALSINIEPTESNEPGVRQDAVRWYLGNIDTRTPRLLIDPRCRRLIGGFAAHYKLTKQATAGNTDKLAVAKNEYSHIHDALQYLCLGHRGRTGIINSVSNMGRGGNVTPLRGNVTPKDAVGAVKLW